MALVEVTQERFYQIMGPLDVNPMPYPSHSEWKLRGGQVIGRSEPGYKAVYGTPTRHYVEEGYIK